MASVREMTDKRLDRIEKSVDELREAAAEGDFDQMIKIADEIGTLADKLADKLGQVAKSLGEDDEDGDQATAGDEDEEDEGEEKPQRGGRKKTS